MTTSALPQHRYGLYYPYFHVRDDRWLKVAALYWPRIIRIVPEDYQTRDSETVGALVHELDFIRRQPPGPSIGAVAPVFHQLLVGHSDVLRSRFGVTEETLESAALRGGRSRNGSAPGLDADAVHSSQIAPQLAAELVECGLAGYERLDLSHEVDRRWLVMDARLVAIYTSVLAEDFARANMLIPTTDQSTAFTITNDWTADAVAMVLLDEPHAPHTAVASATAETIGYLALNFVVPARLEQIPISRIIEIRQRFGAEFLAFKSSVEQAVAEFSALHDIRDQLTLQTYLEDDITVRFAQPTTELRACLASLKVDAAAMAVNVKLQLPASASLVGGAWLTGHPAIAGTAAAAIGLLAVRREAQRQRRSLITAAPCVSYLLHVEGALNKTSLLQQTMKRVNRIGGL